MGSWRTKRRWCRVERCQTLSATGLGKGFADTDRPAETMRFANGDLGTGVSLGFSAPGLPLFARDSVGFSIVYEYNLSQREPSLSIDITFGWSF